MELWVTERQTRDLSLSIRVSQVIFFKDSDYQSILIVDTHEFGRALLLNDRFQMTERDEFIYHEMITHVPMHSHPAPSKVLIIGGGDGGTAREVLKYKVELVEVVEIDMDVIEASKRYLPSLSIGFLDDRCKVIIADGYKYIRELKDSYDIIVVDSTDPVGHAENLFREDFYKAVYESLKIEGLFVSQTESPFFNLDLIIDINKILSKIFPIVYLYLAPIPSYPSGLWSFTIASKKYDPLFPLKKEVLVTRYYTREIHKASFVLPRFLEDAIRANKAI